MNLHLAVVFSLILCTQFFIPGSAQYFNDYELYRYFIVVSNQGNDTESCLNSTSKETSVQNPCKTLDHAVSAKIKNATVIILEPGVFNLSTNATFQNVFNFGLSGNGSFTNVSINCAANASFTFVRSGDIKINGISFYRCGSLHASTVGSAFKVIHKDHVPFYAGFFLAYVKNVTMEDCKITKSPGIGLSLYDVGGEVNIMRSIFCSNSPDLDNYNCSRNLSCTQAGGGIYVEFTYEGALPPFARNNTERLAYQNNNNYMIEGCKFEENFAPEQCFMNYIDYSSGNDHMPFGRGGGLSFFIKGSAMNNQITISHCRFLRNNAIWGAGLFIEIQDETQNNTMLIRRSLFKENYSHTGGGGERSGIPVWDGTFNGSKIIHEDCIYESNFAIQGGGVSHYSPFYHPVDANDHCRKIVFRRCKWINNNATVGSAIGLVVSSDMTVSVNNMIPNPKGLLLPYIVELEDCIINGNTIVKSEDMIVIGQGALHTYKFPIIFRGNTTFTNNSNTALVLDNAVLKVYGKTTFTNNAGFEGGAIGMYGASLLNLMPDSSIYFKNNRAKDKGGALYVDVGGPPIVGFNTTELNTRACFMAYNDTVTVPVVSNWKTNLTFDSNQASIGGGNSIYATSLQACRTTAQKRKHALDWDFIKYIKENGGKVNIGEEISTDPLNIKINEKEWKRSPGEEFSAFIKLIDEKESLVEGIVKLSIDDSGHNDVRLGTSSPLLLIKNKGQNDTEPVSGLMLRGKHGKMFDLTLRTVSGQTISISHKNLKLLDCHQGFHMNQKGGECICSKKELIGISRCSDDRKTVYLKTGYWGGKVDGGKFATYSCPPEYCSATTTNTTKREFPLKKNQLCAEHRNVNIPLCGECQSGYTVSLGSEVCVTNKECNKKNLWLLLVFFLVMLVLVLLVLKINLDIFTAYLNSWLYSYQIMGYLLKANTSGFDHDPFITVVIGIANWKIKGFGFCLYPNLTNFYKLGFNYILPFYILFLLLVLSRIARCFPRWYINRNVSHALCNLLVMCYTNITTISFNILHYVEVGGKWVLYSDGSINFKNDWETHLPFTILAIVLLVFVVLLPIVLVFTPWFFKKFPCLNGYLLFFDIFQNCFEDQEKHRNNRWFAGFYFICRIWILVMALYLPLGPLKRSILEASCILILGIFLYLQPYNTKYNWLNTLDAVLLTNLCLITVFSSALNSDASDSTFRALRILVNVLAYIPLVYLVTLGLVRGVAYFKDDMRSQRNSSSLLSDNTEPSPSSADSRQLHEDQVF